MQPGGLHARGHTCPSGVEKGDGGRQEPPWGPREAVWPFPPLDFRLAAQPEENDARFKPPAVRQLWETDTTDSHVGMLTIPNPTLLPSLGPPTWERSPSLTPNSSPPWGHPRPAIPSHSWAPRTPQPNATNPAFRDLVQTVWGAVVLVQWGGPPCPREGKELPTHGSCIPTPTL